MKKFFESPAFKKLIIILAVLGASLAIFWMGTVVGYRHAGYSARWIGHHAVNGALGTVMSVEHPIFKIRNRDETERMILLSPRTVVRKFRSSGTTTDIRVGDFVVTIGSPDQEGRIVATFVRIMPPPSTSTPPYSR